MINSNATSPHKILIQFCSSLNNNQVIDKFKNNLRANNIYFRQTPLDVQNKINFYSCKSQIKPSPPLTQIQAIVLKYSPSLAAQNKQTTQQKDLIVSMIYQQDKNQKLEPKPQTRTILLRECLPQLINFHYQIQTTKNQLQTLKYLTNFILTLITVQDDKQLSFFDQKFNKFNSTTENISNKDPVEVWKNMLYQIHGMEAGKVEPLAEKFPTVESLYRDLGGPRTIENISSMNQIGQEKKIKKSTIKKIQQMFLSMDASEEMEDE